MIATAITCLVDIWSKTLPWCPSTCGDFQLLSFCSKRCGITRGMASCLRVWIHVPLNRHERILCSIVMGRWLGLLYGITTLFRTVSVWKDKDQRLRQFINQLMNLISKLDIDKVNKNIKEFDKLTVWNNSVIVLQFDWIHRWENFITQSDDTQANPAPAQIAARLVGEEYQFIYIPGWRNQNNLPLLQNTHHPTDSHLKLIR